MKIKKGAVFFLFLFIFYKECSCFFIFSSPEKKARKYLSLSLQEYRKAIKENPENTQILEEYKKLLECQIGKTEAKVEIALIFQEINLTSEVSRILLEISISERENALKYIEKRVEKSQDIKEKINLYTIATILSPQNPSYWYNLGNLLLGINKIEEGISALEKAYNYNFKEPSLFYYLSSYYFQKGDYKRAKFYIDEGLKISDDISLHKILLKIYLSEGNREMALSEKEKIKNLMMAKKEKIPEKIEEKPKIEKIEGLNPYFFIGVSKEQQKLYLVQFNGEKFNVIKEYVCTTGKNRGDKERKGDGRTPEGTYLLVSKIEGENLPPKYGICAFPLNFPNTIDKKLNKDGDGIWFHATPIERPPYNSEGCVVVNDNDMEEIMDYIKVGQTFICISKDDSFLKFRNLKEIKSTVDNWKKAWESKNIESYINFYDDNFFTDGKNKNTWKSYKERINKRKKFIKVDISDLQILPYGQTKLGFLAVAFFKQKYTSDNFSSKTRKILYLVKRDGRWKIICEQVIK